MPILRRFAAVLAVLLAVACGSDGTGPSGGPLCTAPTDVALAVGEVRIVDALNETSCVGLSGGEGEREYLVVAYAGEGAEAANGISGGYQLAARPGEEPQVALAAKQGLVRGFAFEQGALAFHQSLRLAERALVQGPLAALSRLTAPAARRDPPVVGEQDNFKVCANSACTSTVPVAATVRYAGSRGVIYLDNEMPAGADAFTQADLDQLGTLFDDYIHPIDTAAFGAVSDLDGDERIAILITDQVNDLSPNCTEGRIVGYFFGGDLLFARQGSNQREVFFAFAPKPATSTCNAVTRTSALRALPPVLIHELQHMISFNEHVLRRGQSDESVWLNEALSHFAEELGQRLIPDPNCPASASCFSQFASGNLQNAYLYLEDPEATFLVAPSTDGPTLAGRGAGWLFVRWIADHFAADTLLGTQVTRALLQRGTPGAANIAGVTGQPFDRLVGEWLLANWLENLTGFPVTGRLNYRTWNLRSTYAANYPAVFDRPYPLEPDVTDRSFAKIGTLRGGSGGYLRVVVPAGQNQMVVRLADQSGVTRIGAQLRPRIAVARIR